MGFEYENVWVVTYNNSLDTKNGDSINLFYNNLRSTLTTLPEVEDVSFSNSNVPFSDSHSSNNVNYKGREYNRINIYQTDPSYNKVWQMRVLEGHWFTKEDIKGKYTPVVIDSTFKELLFGQESAIGKVLGHGDKDTKERIIGVVANMKVDGNYYAAGNSYYNLIDTADYRWLGTLSIRVTPDANASFESRLYKLLANTMKKSNISIEHSVDMRRTKNDSTIIPLIIFMIVAGFLIINVALGLFGVLWYSINRRKGEIGLRRAIGATGASVSYQLIAESLILASLALLVGSFFALQLPLLNVFNIAASVYLIAILIAVVFIYLLVFLCSLYPGKQAAAILPAIALHEE